MNKLKTINLLRLLVNCKKYLTYKQDPDTKEADDLLYEINNYIDGITNMQKMLKSLYLKLLTMIILFFQI